MIIFANNMQQEFLKSKENKVLIATSIGSGKSYALYLKALTLLEEDNKFVGFCRYTVPQVRSSYFEFKDKFKKYKYLRFSDTSFIVEHKKTGSKVKFVTQESCYGFDTVIVDSFNHFKSDNINFMYFSSLNKLFSCVNACDYDKEKHGGIFDKVVSGYGVCDELIQKCPDYLTCINRLTDEDKNRLLMQSPRLI